MPLSKNEQMRYLQEMREKGGHPCQIELPLATLTILISALQLATRHPQLPDSIDRVVRQWVDRAIAAIAGLAPAVATGLRAGNDPANDIDKLEAMC